MILIGEQYAVRLRCGVDSTEGECRNHKIPAITHSCCTTQEVEACCDELGGREVGLSGNRHQGGGHAAVNAQVAARGLNNVLLGVVGVLCATCPRSEIVSEFSDHLPGNYLIRQGFSDSVGIVLNTELHHVSGIPCASRMSSNELPQTTVVEYLVVNGIGCGGCKLRESQCGIL